MADPTESQGPQGHWLLDTARATGIGVWLGNTLGSVTERWAEKEVSVSYLAPLAQETRPPPISAVPSYWGSSNSPCKDYKAHCLPYQFSHIHPQR